jgi:hypothetical protein
MMPVKETFESLVKDMPEDFIPIAYYDKHLDCIRVQTKDCSFIEERSNKIFTILKRNHVQGTQYVGFTIKGVRYLFEKLGLSTSGVIEVTSIIEKIVQTYPDHVVNFITEIFGRTMKEKHLTVSIDDAQAA